jgi:cell division transport system permease protein
MAEPLQSSLTILVIAIALALPAMFWVTMTSLQQLSASWKNNAQMTIFIDTKITQNEIEALLTTVENLPQVDTVEYISPKAALEEFQGTSGFGEALSLLDSNPLPMVLLISPAAELIDQPGESATLMDDLAKLAGVDQVQLDMQWLQRLSQILEMGQRVAVLLGFLLALGVLLVVANTIRLAIESRRDEILVVKLVGGTNAFVRRPFLYTGLWYGLFGGIVAWAGVMSAGMWLDDSVTRLAELYQSDFTLVKLNLAGLLMLMVFGGILGLLGATLAVGRNIALIEP